MQLAMIMNSKLASAMSSFAMHLSNTSTIDDSNVDKHIKQARIDSYDCVTSRYVKLQTNISKRIHDIVYKDDSATLIPTRVSKVFPSLGDSVDQTFADMSPRQFSLARPIEDTLPLYASKRC